MYGQLAFLFGQHGIQRINGLALFYLPRTLFGTVEDEKLFVESQSPVQGIE